MPSERLQRRIDQFLDEAEAAIESLDWRRARERAQAVLNLDPGGADAQAFIDAAARAGGAETPPEPGAESPQAVAALPTAFVSDRYQIRALLGDGARKVVYRAHDTRLDRDVAFALIKTAGLDADGRARIQREAQAMARLTHPNVVTIHDIGDEDGQPYIVAEYMGGGDVAGLLREADDHRLPIDRAITIADAVAQALAHAHAQRVIHRDVKPGNIWLAADGSARLGDFGLALAIDQTRMTTEGTMLGTVAYMPPEQATGGVVDPRSDLYALGCVLYEMVTGRPPFPGDDVLTVISQHLNTAPVAPTWDREDCPAGLDALILALLEKDAAKRPASAADVRTALATANDATPTSTPATDRPATTPGPVYRRTFVGRERELGQLKAAFDAALSGQGGLVMVMGEPGIGKTTLTEQLATYVRLRGGQSLVGHCYEEGSLSLPYLPFVEAMRSYILDREPEALAQELGSGAGDVARIVAEIRDRLGIEPPAATTPEEDRYRLLQSVTTFLRNAAAAQPLCLVLEDLHDADQGTLELLQHVARQLAGARLLIVGTYRDVDVDRAHPLSATLAELRRGATFDRVTLRGLTTDEVQRMLANIVGRDAPGRLGEAVHRQTEGNPLFIQEVFRYIAEEGLLKRQADEWTAISIESLVTQIPEGLRDVIGKRLSRLSERTDHVLAVAAVIGRDFDLDTLRAVAGVPEAELLAALEETEHAAVIEERAQVGGARYRFTHAFFRQTLYEELIAPRRLRLHHQIGLALEQRYANRLDEHAAELAEHFTQSADPAVLSKAVDYGERAAERSLAVYAYGEATRLLERAVAVQEALDPHDAARRCDLALALAEALLAAGEPRRVYDDVAQRAFEQAERIPDPARISHACRLAVDSLISAEGPGAFRTDAGREWTQRADQHAAPGTLERAWADNAVGLLNVVQGKAAEGTLVIDGAIDLARKLDDPNALYTAVTSRLQMLQGPDEEQKNSQLAAELSRPTGSRAKPQPGPWKTSPWCCP